MTSFQGCGSLIVGISPRSQIRGQFYPVTFMFYAYIWLRQDGTPYYVGKGKGDRAFEQTGHRVRRPQDSDSIIVQEYETEDDAFEAERFFIAYFGRLDLGTGVLTNLTDGGEGPAGFVPSNDLRRLWSEQRQANPSRGFQGHRHSEQAKARIARHGEQNPFFGKSQSEKMRKSVTESNRRRVWTPESLTKMANGVSESFTPERKKFMSSLSKTRVRVGGRFAKAG